MQDMKHSNGTFKFPSSEEFITSLGQASWLIGLSEAHKNKPITWIEPMVIAPLILKQARVFIKGKQPIGLMTWAFASAEVKAKIEQGEQLRLSDWKSGTEITIVDCVSPFIDEGEFRKAWLTEVTKRTNAQRELAGETV